MIVFDFDEVVRGCVGVFIMFIFGCEVNVEAVEEIRDFVTNAGHDIENRNRMQNFDEVLLHGLLDMNHNFVV